MKKIIPLLAICSTLIFVGCENAMPVHPSHATQTQNVFDSITYHYYKESWHSNNDLVRDELFYAYAKELTQFFDTVMINDWEGELTRVHLMNKAYNTATEENENKIIRFEISTQNYYGGKINDKPNCTFSMVYTVNGDSIDTDPFYKAFRELEYSKILFSGEIVKKKDFVITNEDIWGGVFRQPDFMIHLTDIQADTVTSQKLGKVPLLLRNKYKSVDEMP